jgi:alanine racemase
VDTGMQRTGMRPETAIRFLQWIQNQKAFTLVGVYSHFATADREKDPFALKQIQEFQNLRSVFSDLPLIWHLANSSGFLCYPTSYFDMVRPGLLCYGYFPNQENSELEIFPCFSLKAKVSFFKVVNAGEGISYGHLYKTESQTRIVTVPVGYGDGYHRSLSNRSYVFINKKRYPIVGAICMDQFMVDIGNDTVFVGDEVTLISPSKTKGPTLQEIAQLAGTIPYELLCSFNNRLNRKYVF